MANVYAQFIIANSVAVYVVMGPFLDANNGKIPLTTLEIEQSDVLLSMNNGPFAAKEDAGPSTHIGNGFYQICLSINDTSSSGQDLDNILLISINMPGALPVWKEFRVTPALPA